MSSFVHIHIVALRYFTETARQKSMRRAADILNIAPSAVNRQILKLEDQLQCKLFERATDGVRLTSGGEVLYRYALTMERNLERVIADIDDLRGIKRGHVRIACEDGIARDFLPSMLQKFNKLYERVTFSLEVTTAPEVVARVSSGMVDVGLTMSTGAPVPVVRVARIVVPLGIITHPEHPLASQKDVIEADLDRYPRIERTPIYGDPAGFHSEVQDLTARRQFINTNASDVTTNLVKHGLGIGLRTPVGIMGDLKRDEVRFIPYRIAPRATFMDIYSAGSAQAAASVLTRMMQEELPLFQLRVYDAAGLKPPSPES